MSTTQPQTLRAGWLALAGLSAVFLFEMLDNSVLNVALPTIGRDLHASTTALQWITNSYAVVFGGLMLLLGAVADRVGRRRVMLVGLALLAVASLATLFVRTAEELVAVRAAMGFAAAMTTPGSNALAFRLFGTDDLRVRAMNLITTVGLIGLAVGPTVGGLVLAIAPWQVLLLANAPIAVLALIGIRLGIAADTAEELPADPVDVAGATYGTATIVLALAAPTLFVEQSASSPWPWAAVVATALGAALFVRRQRRARYPLLDLGLIARPLVSSGLLYKAASGLAIAGLGYLVTLQLQLDWGWPPALAAVGMLPQVVVLVAGGPAVTWFVRQVGLERAAWTSAASVVAGLAVFALLSRFGYPFVALALVLEAAGMRVLGVASAMNVMRGLPADRTTVGAALVDTSSQVTTGIGIAVAGTVLAAVFPGDVADAGWSALQHVRFEEAVTIGGLILTAAAAALVAWALVRARAGAARAAEPVTEGTRA